MKRQPNLRTAAAELGFAAAAFASGVFGAPLWGAGLVVAAMVVYWVATRSAALRRLGLAAGALQGAVALAVLIVVLAGAYGLGLAVRGTFT